MRVAITGKICSGKTTLSNFLKDYGAHVIFADEIVHQLMQREDVREMIENLMCISIDWNKDWKNQLANILFSDSESVINYRRWFYPFLFQQMCDLEETGRLNVWDVPLLFEIGWHDSMDCVVLVVANDDNIRKVRAIERGINSFELERRDRLFFADEVKKIYSDYVIENNGMLQDLREQAYDLWADLCSKFDITERSSNGCCEVGD